MFPFDLLWYKDCLPPQNLLKVRKFNVENLKEKVLTLNSLKHLSITLTKHKQNKKKN